jgi:hypothetical protein
MNSIKLLNYFFFCKEGTWVNKIPEDIVVNHLNVIVMFIFQDFV